MTVKEIREHFKKETNLEIYVSNEEQASNEYNQDYVKWLERKLADFLTQ